MPRVPVTILPSLPSEGWLSMNRYWEALGRNVASYTGDEFHFSCPLAFAGICTQRKGKLRLGLEKQVFYPLSVRRNVRSGIAHILDHSYAFLLPSISADVKKIVTVHDLLPLREPEEMSASEVTRFRSRVENVNTADLILTDSMATRQDLVALMGTDPAKIQVLPLGVDPVQLCAIGPLPWNIQGKFLFSIGGYMRRKNLEILPKVLEIVRHSIPDIKLIRAGGKLPEALVKEFNHRCGPDALVELGKVSEDLLSSLYQSASATIVPSRYEGFGLPILEAMARQCPVVAAHTSSLPEVGGDAAFYFSVDDADQCAAQILKILNFEDRALAFVKAQCLEHSQQFTWDMHFSKLLDIYRKLSLGFLSA